ncbi:hypothetical protein JCM8097_003209 [Rhodosporidiobolus ruineniae]
MQHDGDDLPPYTAVEDDPPPPPSPRLLSSPPPAPSAPSSSSHPARPSKRASAYTIVTPSELAAHLTLLRFFRQLGARVRAASSGSLASLSPAERWSAYLRLGALRLQAWLDNLAQDPALEPLSFSAVAAACPDDAVVVWHAWCIAGGGTGRYEEDCIRRWWDGMIKLGQKTGGWTPRRFPLKFFARRIDPKASTPRNPELWERQTRNSRQKGVLGWDALAVLARGEELGVAVACPREECTGLQTIPLLTPSHTGFLQPLFSIPCERCKQPLTRPLLGLARMFETLAVLDGARVAVLEQPRDEDEAERMRREKRFTQTDYRGLLAGSLAASTPSTAPVLASRYLTPPTSLALTSAQWIFDGVEGALFGLPRHWRDPRKKSEGGVPKDLEGMGEVWRRIEKGETGLGWKHILHLLSAHTTPHDFSLDVALAALRLTETSVQLERLGWLDEGWAEGDEAGEVLEEAVGRYEKFLTIASKINEKGPVVPPLDIDFVWHTHLLVAPYYREDHLDLAGAVIPHVDAVEESTAIEMWEYGKKIWEEKYHTPLSFFPSATVSSPPSSSKGKGKVKQLFSRSSASSSSSSTPASSSRPQPQPEATAPSSHPSLLIHLDRQSTRRRKRKEGETPVLMRSEQDRERGEEGVWVLSEEEAHAQVAIAGVDNWSPDDLFTPRPHRWAYDLTRPRPAPTASSSSGVTQLDILTLAMTH